MKNCDILGVSFYLEVLVMSKFEALKNVDIEVMEAIEAESNRQKFSYRTYRIGKLGK